MSADRRPWWVTAGKLLGVAGLLGVTAGGVLVARNERQRRAYTPDEIRQHLHERAARAHQSPQDEQGPGTR